MFATFFLPDFYLQAVTRHQPSLAQGPLGVLDASESKAVLWQINDAASALGVETGMTPSQALARCLSLVIKPRAREVEQQIDDILLHHAFMLSPFVEATASGICTIELPRSDRVSEKLKNAVNLLQQCHLQVRIGAAENPDTSFLAAHLAEPVLVVDQAEPFLSTLPLEILAT